MTSALSITRAVNPPRASFLDFPLGHTVGKPHDPDGQRAILSAALRGFESIRTPGGVTVLPFAWSDDDSWKDSEMRAGPAEGASTLRDDRTERHAAPQYQFERDRELADEAERKGGCPTCVCVE